MRIDTLLGDGIPRLSASIPRRAFLGLVAVGLGACASGTARSADLLPTPAQTAGPFYPDHLPLDRDNDLVLVQGRAEPGKGTIAHLHGRILDPQGRPVRDAVVEIWQCDANGVYLHSRGGDRARLDAGFQGFGRCKVGADGAYRFRTIRPVAYPGRAPHIHVKVLHGEQDLLTTQCYVAGDPGNERDGILRAMDDQAARRSLVVDFTARAGTPELDARFDIVLGTTPKA
jgi:protocatechuate 3,4-dioxygenase beta subunit